MPLNIDYEGTENERVINSAKLKAFLAMTPIESGAYVDSYVVDLATAKDTLKDAVMLISVMKDFILTMK